MINNALNHMVGFNGYPLSAAFAVVLHLALWAGLLYVEQMQRDSGLELAQPTIIKALIIDENPQVVNRERQRLERIEQQRIAEERRERRAAEAAEEAAREAERERQLQQQQAERQRLIERQELERLQAEQQRQRLEQEQREDAVRREQERRLAEQERQRQRLEQERQREGEAAAAAAARTEFELVQSATAIIQQYVQAEWSRPPSARNGMRAILRIEMLPTGEVTSVSITESSGDAAFDRSAETAVYRAAPFSELQQLPINVFTENFRTLTLIFQPEDLLN